MSLLNNINIKVWHIFIEYILYMISYCDIIRIFEIFLDYMEDITNKGKGLYVISMVFFSFVCKNKNTFQVPTHR